MPDDDLGLLPPGVCNGPDFRLSPRLRLDMRQVRRILGMPYIKETILNGGWARLRQTRRTDTHENRRLRNNGTGL